MEKKHQPYDLVQMQSLPLESKIRMTQRRIQEWYEAWDGKVYISFSGGKDSTVLADLTARICQLQQSKLVLWFSDTGLEYPEVRKHVKSFPKYIEDKYGIEVELIMDYPKDRKGKRITFRDVILTKGYPIISKEVARDVCVVKNKPDGKTAQKFIRDSDYHKNTAMPGYLKNGHILLILHLKFPISVVML